MEHQLSLKYDWSWIRKILMKKGKYVCYKSDKIIMVLL